MYLSDSTNRLLTAPQSTPKKNRFVFTNQSAENGSSDSSSTVIQSREKCPRHGKRRKSLPATANTLPPGAIMSFKNTGALCGDLEKLLSLPEMCDIKFLVGKSKTPVYGVKAILATRNRAFFSMILSKQKCEVHAINSINQNKVSFLSMIKSRLMGKPESRHMVLDVPEFDPISFRKVITYLQTGDIKVNTSDVIGVMNAAHTYGLEDLRGACFRFACGSLSVKTVLPLVKSAERYWTWKWTKLVMNEVLHFVCQKGDTILGQKEFATLSQESAILMLTSPDLAVSDEKKWDAALRWAKRQRTQKDKKVLKSALKVLTGTINFHNISLKKLLCEVKPLSVLPDDVMADAIARWSGSPALAVGQNDLKSANDEQRTTASNQNGHINRMFTCCSSESLTTAREPSVVGSPSSAGGFVLTSESSFLI